ncbi:MAG: hypothetical protein U0231_17970 [Nitrospiraceae bacterium]
MREQTPDLKTFGRVDAALLHGTSFGRRFSNRPRCPWMQTNPTLDERQRCLSCHAPAVTVFLPACRKRLQRRCSPANPKSRGIGCASCHLINAVEKTPLPPPTFKVQPGSMLYGPYTRS